VQRSRIFNHARALAVERNSLTFIRLTPSLRVIRELLVPTIVRLLQ
jgi:hypothetical protein